MDGKIIKLIKEPDNEYDSEAIAAFLPFIDKIGYVANSTNTVYCGTISSGRLYDKIEDYAYGRIMFITHSSAIALVLDREDVEEPDDEDDEGDCAFASVEKVKLGKKTGKPKGVKQPIGFKA